MYEYLIEECEQNIPFDRELYAKISAEIVKFLGKKEQYTVEEPVFYLQTKYLAYQVPYAYVHCYQDM